MTIISAKNENLKNGLGQCLAEMVAARVFNERASNEVKNIYGAVTSGNQWKLLKLDEAIAYIDISDYYIVHLGKIMGILLSAAAPYRNNLGDFRSKNVPSVGCEARSVTHRCVVLMFVEITLEPDKGQQNER